MVNLDILFFTKCGTLPKIDERLSTMERKVWYKMVILFGINVLLIMDY